MTIKGVWGFNGTERPGAVYLASVLATHAQKGLPAFGIYGHDVQDADATDIPADVEEKLLRFGRAAVAAATMRGKSYLQIGSICMGIGGSIIDPAFIGKQLRCCLCHIHRLVFQRFPYLQITPSSIDRRPDADYRIIPNHSVFCHLIIPPFQKTLIGYY